MRAGSLVRTMLGMAVVWSWLLPSTAGAFPLSNCSLQATSTRAGGGALDTATSGAESATSADPFVVDWDGTVTWTGSATIALKDNSYQVTIFGLPVLSGSSASASDNRSGSGTVRISEFLPFRVTGLYYVSGSIKGSGGTCEGSGVIKLDGDPLGSIPFLAGLGLMLLGGLLLAFALFGPFALFGSIPFGVAAGLLAGVGAAIEAIAFGAAPAGALTPLGIIALFVFAGVGLPVARRLGS